MPSKVSYYRNLDTSGGALHPEWLMATVPVGGGYLLGLRCAFRGPGRPEVTLIRRTTHEDLLRSRWEPITAERASALDEALPAFVEALERAW